MTAINFFLFQASWWGIFLLAKHFGALAIPGMALIASVFLLIHYKILSQTPKQDFFLMLKSVALGIALDGVMLWSGLLAPTHSWLIVICTLLLLWFVFSATLNSSLKTLRSRRGVFVFLTAVFGPLTYLAAEQIALIEYGKPKAVALGAHAILWSIWAYLLAERPAELTKET